MPFCWGLSHKGHTYSFIHLAYASNAFHKSVVVGNIFPEKLLQFYKYVVIFNSA